MRSSDQGVGSATALVLALALLLGGGLSLLSASLLELSTPWILVIGGTATSLAFRRLQAVELGPDTLELSPERMAILEAASVGLIGVSAGLAFYYVSVPIWSTVTGEPALFPDLLAQWDAGWYGQIVEQGYDRQVRQSGAVEGQADWAFFPLYPMLVRATTALTGFGTLTAGTMTSVVSLAIACAFAYRYLVLTRSRAVARLGVGLLVLGPYSFYSYTLYTESLFICLVAIGFWALETDRYGVAALAGGLLSATRGVGVLFGLAMFVHLVLRTDAFAPLRSSWPWRLDGETARAFAATLSDRRVLLLALVPVGLLAYMVFLWLHVGQPLAFLTIQSAWDRTTGNPISLLLEGLQAPVLWTRYWAWIAVLGLALAVDLVRRGHTVEGVFGLALLIVPLSSGVRSIPRFAVGTTVLVFALADALSRTKLSRTVGFGLLTAANALLLALWYSRHYVVQ